MHDLSSHRSTWNLNWYHLVGLVLLLTLSSGCGLSQATPPAGAVQREATIVLPTPPSKPEASPVNTRVMPLDVLTPPATWTITPIPDESLALVVEVIDGDTIAVVMDGDPARRAYQVHYIGIEAPPNSSTDPWGVVAYETNQQLTKLKVVRLVRDETDFDSDGYLLRHVYLGNQLISLLLVEEGLARVALQEPNTAMDQELQAAEARAREARIGLWGPQPPTTTPIQRAAATPGEGTEEPPSTPGEGTEEPVSTGTPEATGEPTEETTPEAGPTEEPTEEGTETPTATRTATATEEPTEEATPENP